jgi:hypothetical protein
MTYDKIWVNKEWKVIDENINLIYKIWIQNNKLITMKRKRMYL